MDHGCGGLPHLTPALVLFTLRSPSAYWPLRSPRQQYRPNTICSGFYKMNSKTLEYEYRVKTDALDTLKRYFILSLTLYLE